MASTLSAQLSKGLAAMQNGGGAVRGSGGGSVSAGLADSLEESLKKARAQTAQTTQTPTANTPINNNVGTQHGGKGGSFATAPKPTVPQINALGAGDYGANSNTRVDNVLKSYGERQKSVVQRTVADVTEGAYKSDPWIKLYEKLFHKDDGEQQIEEGAQNLRNKAAQSTIKAAQYSEKAKEGLGAVGRTAVDVAGGLLDVGTDIATGGRAMAFVRGYAGGANSAAIEGDDLANQTAKGAVEGLLNWVFEGLGGIFGGKLSANVKSKVLTNLGKSVAGKTALKALQSAPAKIAGSGISEASEEVLGGYLIPVAEKLLGLKDEAWGELFTDEDIADIWSQALTAGIIGVGIGGANMAMSRAQANAIVKQAVDDKLQEKGVEAPQVEQAPQTPTTPEEITMRAVELMRDYNASQNAPQAAVSEGQQTTPSADENGTGVVKTANAENVAQSKAQRMPTPNSDMFGGMANESILNDEAVTVARPFGNASSSYATVLIGTDGTVKISYEKSKADADRVVSNYQAMLGHGMETVDTAQEGSIQQAIINIENARNAERVAYADAEYGSIEALDAEADELAALERQQEASVQNAAANHIDNRTMDSVADRKVNAFQHEHPELHQYFAETAQDLKIQIEDSLGTQGTLYGQGTVSKTNEILEKAKALGISRPKLLTILDDIIANHGAENYADAKRVEILLDDMMTNGYRTASFRGDGIEVGRNQNYIAAKEALDGGTGNPVDYLITRGINSYKESNFDADVTDYEALNMMEMYPELYGVTAEQVRAYRDKMGYAPTADDGLGAANMGFTDRPMTQGEQWVAEAQNQGDSAIQPISNEQMGEVIARGEMPQDVPKVDLNGHLTSKTISTVVNSGVTPQEMSDAIIEDAAQGKFSRIPYTDAAALSKAEAEITNKGWEKALAKYEADVEKGIGGKDMAVMGITLYNNAVTKGDYATAMDILSLMVKVSTSNAQGVQAMRILNKLSPDGKLYMAFKSAEYITEEIKQKYGLDDDITIDPALISEYRNALMNGDKTAIREAWGNIEQNIADQIPPNWRDKANAWRYLAMLGNPRTHVRNIVGNLGFTPVRAIKDVIATSIEMGVDKISGGKIERTKAFLNPASAEDRALIATAWADYANASEAIMSGGKFNDLPNTIDDRRQIFGFKLLEGARRFNTNALNVEDKWFSQPAYAAALAGYLKANGISAQDYANGTISDDAAAKAQEYAIKEAQKATYRDTNWLSKAVSKLHVKPASEDAGIGEKLGRGAARVFTEGVVPFKKTPANILTRAVEYSPLGLTAYITAGTVQVARGKMTSEKAVEFIDGLASGLTGTGILMLGAFLAKEGLLSGGGDDDRELEKLQGVQDYSLNVGGKSITLDWLAPEALPLFVGVELWNNMLAKDETASVWDFISSLGNITEPMFEMSMLQGVSTLFDTIGYANKPVWSVAKNVALNFFSQFVPTIFGQIERAFTEDTRQSTFIDKNSETPSDIQYFLGQIGNKSPGEFQQIEYVDAWGRRQETGDMFERMMNNFLNPAYINDIRVEDVEAELNRLSELGETNVFPQKPSQSTQINGKYLTAEQYQKYATDVGQTSLTTVTALTNSAAYKQLSDADKAELVRDAYTYAKGVAALQIDKDANVASWITEAKAFGDAATYIAARNGASNLAYEKGKQGAKKEATINYINSLDISPSQKAKLFSALNPDWKTDGIAWS